MNRKHGAIAVAFILGGLASFGILKLAVAPVASAQAMNPLVAQRLNVLEKRIAILENQNRVGQASQAGGGPLHPGAASATTSAVQNTAQLNQVTVLQGEVDTLKSELQKLQTQFATHYHTYTVSSESGTPHGIATILMCHGIGKPCESASGLGEVTVLVPPNVTPPPPTAVTVQTSGPVMPNK